jgi:hypothetical protein
MTPPDFRQLICRAQAGDTQALERLLALTRPLIVRVVASDPARLPHADESIEDLSQDVCMRVFRKLRSIRGTSPNLGGGSPGEAEAGPQADDEMVWKLYRSWLRKTARRIVLNDRQRHQRRQVLAPHTQLQVDGDGLAPQGATNRKRPGRRPAPRRAATKWRGASWKRLAKSLIRKTERSFVCGTWKANRSRKLPAFCS